jgi:hypothetical protein
MDRLTDTAQNTFLPVQDGPPPLQTPNFSHSVSPRPDSPRPFLLPLAQIYPRVKMLVNMFPNRYDDLDHLAFPRLALALEKLGFDQTGQDTGRALVAIIPDLITSIQAEAHTCARKLGEHYAYVVGCDSLPYPPIFPDHLRKPGDRIQEKWPGLKGERDLLAFLTTIQDAIDGLGTWLWRERQRAANPNAQNLSYPHPKNEETYFGL